MSMGPLLPCMEIELTPTDSEVTVTVSTDRIAEELGEQGILGDDVASTEFLYLSALALETREHSQYDIERAVMEFLRNSSAIDADMSECDEIENILR